MKRETNIERVAPAGLDTAEQESVRRRPVGKVRRIHLQDRNVSMLNGGSEDKNTHSIQLISHRKRHRRHLRRGGVHVPALVGVVLGPLDGAVDLGHGFVVDEREGG